MGPYSRTMPKPLVVGRDSVLGRDAVSYARGTPVCVQIVAPCDRRSEALLWMMCAERELFMDNPLVRIHSIIKMI